MSVNNNNGSNRRINPGVFTCQTCNALFTCLEYYQQHRKQHAESSGIKLLCCKHCPYSTENQFHFNWHVMSHTGEEIHSCSVCKVDESELDLGPSSSNHHSHHNSHSHHHHHHLKTLEETLPEDEEEDVVDLLSGKRSVATATDTDDLLVLGHGPSSTDTSRLLTDDEDPDDATITFLTSSFSPSEDKKFHELGTSDHFGHAHLIGQEEEEEHNGCTNGTMDHGNGGNGDITDEEDDEEEEIESEEDDDLDDFSAGIKIEGGANGGGDLNHHHDHLTGNGGNGSTNPEMDQNQNLENHLLIQQGPPYLKSPNAIPGSDPVPISGRGRGKGNRKSRAIISENGEDGAEIRRKFHCSHCGKSFKTKSHLQRHILTHTGEKPYHCNRCGSKFNQSSSLRNHIIAIHTKEYPHFCPHCNKGFLMPALLTKHLSTNHKGAPIPKAVAEALEAAVEAEAEAAE